VLVKGGHAEGPPDDLLVSAEGSVWLRGERMGTKPVRGTGCALSSAIAVHLARGTALEDAVREAKRFVQEAIASAISPGRGAALLRI
jgi:hydroxymethylpyrimidine/phosphomethylpyrimidine kinase